MILKVNNHKEGFDLILSCTASEDYIINEEIYKNLLNGDKTNKTIVDLAIPQDISPIVLNNSPIHCIN